MTRIAAEFFLPVDRADAVKRLHLQAAKHVRDERFSRAATLMLAADKFARLDRIDRQRAEMAAYD